MLLLIPLLIGVAVVFLGVNGIAGTLSLRGACRRVAVLATAATTVVLLLLLLVASLGLARGASGPGRRDPATDEAITSPSRPAMSAPTSPSVERRPGRAVLGPVVRVHAGHVGGLAAGDAVGGLQPETVVQVEAHGFPPFSTARAQQCAGLSCGNDVTVQLSEAGTASFLFLVTEELAPWSQASVCRITTAPCALVIEVADGRVRGELPLLFHDAVPPAGRLRVTPARQLEDGTRVEVQLDGFTPGTGARLVLCGGRDQGSPQVCGRPGFDMPVSIDQHGSASLTAMIHAGDVGTSGVPCGRGDGCSLTVISDEAFVRAEPVTLSFRAPPGASYDDRRLAAGLALAVALLLAGLFLLRGTDWSPLGEEAAPEIDEAEYADLDAIVAALPPEPDLDELIAALG